MRFILLLLVTLTLSHANSKIALLIGNSKYQYLDKLSSPSEDIPALASKLRGLNFEVTELYNLDEKSMKRSIKDFKQKLLQNPNALALFYYSGHGSQAYGDSYLIPIDGDTRDEADVEADGVKVETIAQKMATARTQANVLFLDACRDVPVGKMGGTKGLGQVKHRPSGSLIIYSTSKDMTANDNRVFNKTVLEKLAMNVTLTTLANDISYSVDQKTNGVQVPEVFAKSLPNLCLSGSCAKPKPEVKVVERIVYREREEKRVVKPKPPIVIEKPKEEVHTTKDIVKIGNLMYQNQPFTKTYNWEEAKAYCQDLTLGGYSDWRLPTKRELRRLVTKKKNQGYNIRKEFAKNLVGLAWFWTSTTYKKDSSQAWGVFFCYGYDSCYFKSYTGYALCVQ